jgi:molybdate transport repressor ModE-like protein
MVRTAVHATTTVGARAESLDVRQVRVFLAILERGTIAAGARAVGVAQSTASETLAALERALGVAVVARRRGTHRIELTAAGKALLPHARRLVASVDAAHAAIGRVTERARARVGIVANESISTYLLPPALAEVRRRWPNARFSVTVASCDGVRSGVAAGRFHVGLLLEAATAGDGPPTRRGRAQQRRLARTTIVDDVPLVLFAAPGHPVASRAATAEIRRDQVSHYPIVVSEASGAFHLLLRQFFGADGLAVSPLEPGGSIEGVKRSVAVEPGALGVLPGYAVAEELRTGAFRALRLRPPLPRLRLDCVQATDGPVPPAAAAFIEAVGAAVTGHGRPA